MRLLDRTKPRGSSQNMVKIATFLFSSLWHGFYVGELIAFFTLATMLISFELASKTQLAQQINSKLPQAVAYFL